MAAPPPVDPGWVQYLIDHQLVQPAVTVCVGVLATAFAWEAVLTNRSSARMRATLDFLERLETTEHHLKRYRTFRKVRQSDSITQIVQELRGGDETDRDLCIDFLNTYEFISLGIRKKILDETYFRQAYEPTILRDWHAAAPLINDMRNPQDQTVHGDPTYYEHFQWRVDRWEKPQTLARRFQKRLLRILASCCYALAELSSILGAGHTISYAASSFQNAYRALTPLNFSVRV